MPSHPTFHFGPRHVSTIFPNSAVPESVSRPSSVALNCNASIHGHVPDTSLSLPLSLRTAKDYFIWLHSIRAIHPRAWPYIDPDAVRTPTLPDPGPKPRALDIKPMANVEECLQLGSPVSTSTVVEEWDAELAALRALSDREHAYLFSKVQDWDVTLRERRAIEDAIAAAHRHVIASVPAQLRFLLLGSPWSTASTTGRGKVVSNCYVADLHDGMKKLAKRFRPTDVDVCHWLQELGRPDDRNWEEWLDKYVSIYWMGKCSGCEGILSATAGRTFLDRVQHLNETWARTWERKLEDPGSQNPDVMDMADDWRQWMQFRTDFSTEGDMFGHHTSSFAPAEVQC